MVAILKWKGCSDRLPVDPWVVPVSWAHLGMGEDVGAAEVRSASSLRMAHVGFQPSENSWAAPEWCTLDHIITTNK